MKTIAERVAAARMDLKLTQAELAKRAGVAQGTIGNIEKGIRRAPRELLAIASALQVRPEWLKSGKGPRSDGEAADHEPSPPTLEAALDVVLHQLAMAPPAAKVAVKSQVAALVDGQLDVDQALAGIAHSLAPTPVASKGKR